MAAINFDDVAPAPDGGGGFQAALNWAGAGLSVLLIAGLAVWGWKLWQRDVSGVPVVRALEGPMRVAPENPGGLASEYQGLSVNRIAEQKAPGVVERVVLAPPPVPLNPREDLPMGALAPMEAAEDLAVVAVEEAPAFGAQGEAKLAAVPEAAAEKVPSATDLAVAAALAEEAGLAPTPAALTADAAPGVPVATPRPQVRPEGVRLASVGTIRNDVTGEIDPVTIPPGTRLVQLGAYGSPEVARAEWANAIARFGDYMVGKERVVQEAEVGGRKFWRLRALGFESLADARRFCAVLVADGTNCIPVVQE